MKIEVSIRLTKRGARRAEVDITRGSYGAYAFVRDFSHKYAYAGTIKSFVLDDGGSANERDCLIAHLKKQYGFTNKELKEFGGIIRAYAGT